MLSLSFFVILSYFSLFVNRKKEKFEITDTEDMISGTSRYAVQTSFGGLPTPQARLWYGIIKVELTNSPRRSRITEREGEEK